MRKQFIIFHALPAALFVGLVFCLVLGRGIVNAQVSVVSRTGKSDPVYRPATREKSVSTSRFANAAAENARLRTTLNWTFSGKTQTGWEVYEPLIATTVGTDADTGSTDFAAALSKWQARNSVAVTGILDDTTLGALRTFWQSQRLGRSDFPGDDKLISAPITDFYDPTRAPELLKVERETYAAYKRMIAAAARDLSHDLKFTASGDLASGEKFLRIISAFRSPEYQETLRKQSPNSGSGTLAMHSAHNTGQAMDLYVGGEPVATKDSNRLLQTQTPVYKWLVKNAARFGFYPYYYEPWHWEYVGVRKN